MKTYSILSLAALSLAFCATQAKAETAGTLALGNCYTGITNYVRVNRGENVSGGSAIHFTESRMKTYAGNVIDRLYVNTNNAEGATAFKVFISHSLEEPFDYEQEATLAGDGWNKITLSTPYPIDGKEIYIGYVIDGVNMLCYTDEKDTYDTEFLSKDGKTWSEYDKAYSAALYAVVSGGNLPKHNVRVSELKIPDYVKVGENLLVNGKFINLGAETVNSLEFAYQIGDQTFVETVEGLDVKPGNKGMFNVSGFASETEGDLPLVFSVSKVNGNADLDMTDNSSAEKTLFCRKEFAKRKLLMEVFSTEKCTGCPAGHEIISAAIAGDTTVVELSHHAGYLTDKFTIEESVEYEWFYGGYKSAPSFMFDRTCHKDYYPEYFESNGPLIEVKSPQFANVYAYAGQAPAFATVKISAEGGDGRNVSIHVEGDALLSIPGKSDRLFVYLVEDSIFSLDQRSAEDGYWQTNVVRKSLTPVWGQEIDITAGYAADFEAEIPEEWNAKQMKVVAFVANYNAEDRNDCKVYNTEVKSLAGLIGTAIKDVNGETGLVRMEGTDIVYSDACEGLEIYSVDGKAILVNTPDAGRYSTINMPKGVYVVKVTSESGSETIKFVR